MRSYTIEELRSPSTYQKDPELAGFARRVAAGRWTVERGLSLAEWKAEHLVGRHAVMMACALDAMEGYRMRSGVPLAKTHSDGQF